MSKSTITTTTKTHNAQRRPAMIPADAELTSEDKQAIRLRTGRYPVYFHPAATAAAQRADQDRDQPSNVGGNMDDGSAVQKRKASTTAEQYRERCGENNPHHHHHHHHHESRNASNGTGVSLQR